MNPTEISEIALCRKMRNIAYIRTALQYNIHNKNYLSANYSTMTLVETRRIQILTHVILVRIIVVGRHEIDVFERPVFAWCLGATFKIDDSVRDGGTGDIDEVDVVPEERRGVGVRLVELGVAQTGRHDQISAGRK